MLDAGSSDDARSATGLPYRSVIPVVEMPDEMRVGAEGDRDAPVRGSGRQFAQSEEQQVQR
jgi:hypothetical protein